ncbi:MAG TPA: methionine synthase [Chloroflexota bacterium]|jgi:5-methyltetrahydropteroyltriglutamate--homocysteine methyltransferase
MSAPVATRYRSEVIGSLLRPDYLKQAVERHDAGQFSDEQLRQVEDRAVLEAIQLQEACDIDVIADGEMRRKFWFDPLTASLAGYNPAVPAPAIFTAGDQPSRELPLLPAVTDRLGPKQNLPLDESRFLAQHSKRAYKATLPSLSYASVLYVPGISDKAYPDRNEYMQDSLRLARQLVEQLVAAGVRYIQLDAPRYTHLVSEEGLENFRRLGLDTSTWLGEMIDYDNQLITSFPPEVTFGLHLCRGNHRSMWSVEGGYDAIAEQLFTDLKVNRLLLEYDTPRAGNFAPLRFVSPDKAVVLGLITTKEPEIETDAQLRDRIREASQYVPLERLALSPQCGFASTLPGNLITPEVQRAKLEVLGRVAKEVWE